MDVSGVSFWGRRAFRALFQERALRFAGEALRSWDAPSVKAMLYTVMLFGALRVIETIERPDEIAGDAADSLELRRAKRVVECDVVAAFRRNLQGFEFVALIIRNKIYTCLKDRMKGYCSQFGGFHSCFNFS